MKKRHWHFTIRQPRAYYEEPEREIRPPVEGPTIRVVLEAPPERLQMPLSVELALRPKPPKPQTPSELREELAAEKRRLFFRNAARKQGLTGPGELGCLEDIWEAMWRIERLLFLLKEPAPSGGKRRHPGSLEDFMDAQRERCRREFRESLDHTTRGP